MTIRLWIAVLMLTLSACNGEKTPPSSQAPGTAAVPQPNPPVAPQDPYAPIEDPQKRLEHVQAIQVAMHQNKFLVGSELKIEVDSKQEDISQSVQRILKDVTKNLEPLPGLRPYLTTEQNKKFQEFARECLKTTRELQKESWDLKQREALLDRLIESCTSCHEVFHK